MSLTLSFTRRCFVSPHKDIIFQVKKPCYWQTSSQIYPEVCEQVLGSKYYQKLQKWLHNNIIFTAPHLPPCNITVKYQRFLVTPEKLWTVTARKPTVPTFHSVSHLQIKCHLFQNKAPDSWLQLKCVISDMA